MATSSAHNAPEPRQTDPVHHDRTRGCCSSCQGSGAGDAFGACWDCQGTGHAHASGDRDGLCSPAPDRCPVHGEPWAPTAPDGHRACLFYIPEFGASEDYGCPQGEPATSEADYA